MFLVSGAEKAEILYTVLAGKSDPPLPSQLVAVPDGQRIILCDEAAAKFVMEDIAANGHFTGKRIPGATQAKPKSKH
jgi:hypothetical protein